MYRILVVDDEPDLRFILRRIFEAAGHEVIDAGTGADALADVTGRIPSGVPDLDDLMNGGISVGEATIILGPSGAGKTIVGLNYITEGLNRGERCLYVTFQDTAGQLIKMAAGFGWDLAAARASGQLMVHHIPLGELDLDMLTAHIGADLAGVPVQRVVLDSLAELVFAARETDRFPAYARGLIGLIRASGASLVITSETTTLGPTPDPEGAAIIFLFHNLIQLRYIEMNSATGRALNVVKMRNSDHRKEVYQFEISDDGPAVVGKLQGVTGVLGWSALRASSTTTS